MTAGQAPITNPSTCDSANAANPAVVKSAAVRRPSRRSQTAMHVSPNTARTTPPVGREPVASATPNPVISPAAASAAVGVLAIRRAEGVGPADTGKDVPTSAA
jgi:hypothetical protein